jgi:hypothetical protein
VQRASCPSRSVCLRRPCGGFAHSPAHVGVCYRTDGRRAVV